MRVRARANRAARRVPGLAASRRATKGVAVLSRALAGVAETRAFRVPLSERSAGIKGRRHGYLTDVDWRDCDPDSCGVDYRRPIELFPNVSDYVVAATVTRDPSHPIGRVVGDVLVQPASAHGVSIDGRHIPFPCENRRHFSGLHHPYRLNHPDVYEAMRHWLGPSLAPLSSGDGLAVDGEVFA
jgi:hypothetical protein